MVAFQKILHRWSSFTRYLILFAILNGAAINLPILLGSSDMTTLHYTRAFFEREAYNDSWVPMRQALEYLHTPHLQELFANKPLYTVLFFDQKVKFQYPLTSLLLLEPLRELSPDGFIHDDLLNTISWVGILLMALMLWRILILSISRYSKLEITNPVEKFILLFLCAAFTLTFYPLLKAYVLGQVQAWIDVLFTGMVLAWLTHRKKLSGFLAGLICIIKPQLILLLLWGLLRKQKKFVIALVITVVVFVMISIGAYGLENNLDYFNAVTFIAQHGESYFPNQSVNGLLNRILFNGNNLEWVARSFPPYNLIVYWGTLLTSIALIGLALFWRRREYKYADVFDLSLAVLSFTIASPVAWEHHYGILLPIFAIALPATLGIYDLRKRGMILLAVTFSLSSNFFQFTDKTAATYFNFLQSYLFFGAMILLFHLYRLRHTVKKA
jgi:hypothetical protein